MSEIKLKYSTADVDNFLISTDVSTDNEIRQTIENSTYTFAPFFKKYKDTEFAKYANLLISSVKRLKQCLENGHIPSMFETDYMKFDSKTFQETCFEYCVVKYLNGYNASEVIDSLVSQIKCHPYGNQVFKEIMIPFINNFNGISYRSNGINRNELILTVIVKLGTPPLFKDNINDIIQQSLDPEFKYRNELISLFAKQCSFQNIYMFYTECLKDYTADQVLCHLFSTSKLEFKLENLIHFKSILHLFPYHVEKHIRLVMELPNYLEIFERISLDGKMTPGLMKSIFDDRKCRNNTEIIIQIMKVVKETDRIVMLDFIKYVNINLNPNTLKDLFVTGVQTRNQALFKYAHPDLAATLDEPIHHTVDPIVEQIGVLLQIHSLRTK